MWVLLEVLSLWVKDRALKTPLQQGLYFRRTKMHLNDGAPDWLIQFNVKDLFESNQMLQEVCLQ